MTGRGRSGSIRKLADNGRAVSAGAGFLGREMTKSELIAELSATNPHLTGRDVELIVGTIFNEITAALARGERVELRGFGAFTVKRRDARTGRNPRTGEAVPVDEKAVPFFKAGKELRERVNKAKGARATAERMSA